jgi:hypothetical protein
MNISKKQKKIFAGKICPYCNSKTKKVSQDFVYGKTYGKGYDLIVCNNYPNCNSYVGTHKNGIALGRLAGYQLRIAKKKAHESFDLLWKNELIKRETAYKLLSKHLQIPIEYTHIGMFQISTCYKVVDWSKELLLTN